MVLPLLLMGLLMGVDARSPPIHSLKCLIRPYFGDLTRCSRPYHMYYFDMKTFNCRSTQVCWDYSRDDKENAFAYKWQCERLCNIRTLSDPRLDVDLPYGRNYENLPSKAYSDDKDLDDDDEPLAKRVTQQDDEEIEGVDEESAEIQDEEGLSDIEGESDENPDDFDDDEPAADRVAQIDENGNGEESAEIQEEENVDYDLKNDDVDDDTEDVDDQDDVENAKDEEGTDENEEEVPPAAQRVILGKDFKPRPSPQRTRCAPHKKVGWFGKCKRLTHRYYYNSRTGSCHRVLSSACDGNTFPSRVACDRKCLKKRKRLHRCLRPMEAICGFFRIPRFYFDKGTCKKYLGCRVGPGSGNDFATIAECFMNCERFMSFDMPMTYPPMVS